jgi:hypothetical protein
MGVEHLLEVVLDRILLAGLHGCCELIEPSLVATPVLGDGLPMEPSALHVLPLSCSFVDRMLGAGLLMFLSPGIELSAVLRTAAGETTQQARWRRRLPLGSR